MRSSYDIVIIGAGAAGLAAGRRLAPSGASFLILEARDRIGGRGWTLPSTHAPLDLGCAWLHSADRNVWRERAEELGFTIDRTPAPWGCQSGDQGFSHAEQAEFGEGFAAFEERIDKEAERDEPKAAAAYLEPGSRWNPLLNAVFSYISGAVLTDIDARDYARYEDTGANWRVREGYGALIAAYGAALPIALATPAQEIDHSGAALRIATAHGDIEARAAIVTIPTNLIANGALRFTPDLPHLREAADALPLGTAEKIFLALAAPEEFPSDGHLFGRIDTAATGSYHLRSLGRPIVECYFGASLARELAEAGADAMAAFAIDELANLLGASVRARLTPIAASRWCVDEFAQGSYSYARPGAADARAALARPHENRLFFAGESCSRTRYSTAHGAFETGLAAAEAAIASL